LTEDACTSSVVAAVTETCNAGEVPSTEALHAVGISLSSLANNAGRSGRCTGTPNSKLIAADLRAAVYSGAIGLKSNNGRAGSRKLMIL
jgi:hypothetical protein